MLLLALSLTTVPALADDAEAPLAIPADPADVAEDCPAERVRPRDRRRQSTVFGDRRRSAFGPYVGLTGTRVRVADDGFASRGFEAGVVLGGKVVLAGAGYDLGFDRAGEDLRLGYGGFQPGLIFGTDKLLHVRGDILLGVGTVCACEDGEVLGSVGVTVPRVALELNVTRSLRIAASYGHRFVTAPPAVARDLSGRELGLTLRFGWM